MFSFDTMKLISITMVFASIVAGEDGFNAILERDYPLSPVDPWSTSRSSGLPTSWTQPPPPPPYPTGPPPPPAYLTCSDPSQSTDGSWSTVYTTEVITITSCAPSITNCPARTTCTTKILSSTPPSSSISGTETIAGEVTSTSTTTPPPHWSTIYTTITYTISSCAPTITNCPYGSITTDVISVTTTYCPVTPPVYPTEPPVGPAQTNTAEGPFITPVTEPPELVVSTITNLQTKTRSTDESSASGTGVSYPSTTDTIVQTSKAGLGTSLSFIGTLLLATVGFCFLF